jgi:GNAT superfamily N-acetyltransferase
MIRSRRGQGITLVELSLDGIKPVSGLEIIDFRMWFSGIQIPAGGIAAVYTKEEHRNHGYARRCLEYALDLQRQEGKLVSLLFGVSHLYERFGYTVVMPWYGVYVSLESWSDLPPEPPMHEYSARYQNAISNIYHAGVGLRIGPAVRDSSTQVMPHKPVRWRTQGIMRILTGPGGEVRGYVWHSEPNTENFEVVEAFAMDDATYAQLLAYLLHETRRREKDQFIAALPPDDPFALFLRRHDAKFVVATRISGGGMARIIHLEGLCRVLEPVFQRRVGLLRRERIPRSLTLSTEQGEGVVELAGVGPPAKIETSPTILTQLLFGYITLAEGFRAGAKGSGISAEVAEVLFPRVHAFMYLRDRF